MAWRVSPLYNQYTVTRAVRASLRAAQCTWDASATRKGLLRVIIDGEAITRDLDDEVVYEMLVTHVRFEVIRLISRKMREMTSQRTSSSSSRTRLTSEATTASSASCSQSTHSSESKAISACSSKINAAVASNSGATCVQGGAGCKNHKHITEL